MAESQPPNSDPANYWCHQCNRQVSVETQSGPSDLVCTRCKNGFIESISISPAENPDLDPSFSNQFLQVLRLISQAADTHVQENENNETQVENNDYLHIELDGWENNNDNDDNDNDEEENDEENDENDEEEEDNNEDYDDENENEDEDARRRTRSDMLQLRLRDFAIRAAGRRNRILDWADILTGLEDHSIELRLQMPDGDMYVGNPGDYVDAAGYESLLQNLADSDGRRGAPPAAKTAILGLESVEIGGKDEVFACAICKDSCEVGCVVKRMPCGHGYHGDCIEMWLGSRNSCPVCRFELPTDDVEYEEGKKKGSGGGGGSSSS